MVWLPAVATFAVCLFELALAILMGVRIWRHVPSKSNATPVGTGQPDLRVVFATLAVFLSSAVILFAAGWLLITLGPQAGAFAAAIFLAHAVLFPILLMSCVRVFQEFTRPIERRQVWRRISRSQMTAGSSDTDSDPADRGEGVPPAGVNDALKELAPTSTSD